MAIELLHFALYFIVVSGLMRLTMLHFPNSTVGRLLAFVD